jgi:hypothetical protein
MHTINLGTVLALVACTFFHGFHCLSDHRFIWPIGVPNDNALTVVAGSLIVAGIFIVGACRNHYVIVVVWCHRKDTGWRSEDWVDDSQVLTQEVLVLGQRVEATA